MFLPDPEALYRIFVDENESADRFEWYKGCNKIETLIRQVYQDGNKYFDTCRSSFITKMVNEQGWAVETRHFYHYYQ